MSSGVIHQRGFITGRRLLWAPLLALGVAAGSAVVGRAVAEDVAARRLRQEAQARGWELRWDELSVGYDLSVRLRGVSAQGPSDATVAIDEALADFDLSALWTGSRRPARVSLTRPRGDLHLDALAAPSPGPTGAPGGAASAWSRALPGLSIEGGALRLRGLPGLGELALDELSAQGDGAGEGWGGVLVGRCASGCGATPQRLRGELSQGDGALRASVALDKAIPLEVEVPGGAPVKLQVRRVSLTLDAEGLRLGVGDLSMPAQVGRWGGDLRVEEVSARFASVAALRRREFSRVEVLGPALTLREVEQDNIAAAPPRAEGHGWLGLLAGAAKALAPHRARAARVRVLRGELEIPGEALRLTGIETEGDEGSLRASARWEGATVSVELREPQDPIRVRWQELSVAALRAHPRVPDPVARFAALRGLDGRLSGELALRPTPEALHLQGRVALEEGLLDIDGLSPVPIQGQALEVNLDATWRPPQGARADRLELAALTLRAPSRVEGAWASAQLKGSVERLLDPDRKPIVSIEAWIEDSPCAQAVGALPVAMMSHLHDQLQMEGRFSPRLTFGLDLEDPRSLKLELEGFPGDCRVKELGAYSPDFLATKFVREVREGVSRGGIMVGPGTRDYVTLRNIPKHTQAAAMLTEDIQFYENGGLSLSLIRRALMLNLEKGRYVYGGSTISQQLVKNLFLTRDKTLSRKLEEAFIVWKMEETISKDRILELYLNCIEFGPDVYGISRASRYYFGKRPSKLTALEGAFLAALKPAPWQGAWFLRAGKSPGDGFWRERMDRIMNRMVLYEEITREELATFDPDYVVTFHQGG